jgi:Rrf2 family nitric oxide-sensitive transcriptional repressor
MQLTGFTDYSLRILIHLAVHQGRRVPLATISSAFGVSHHHLVKACQTLVSLGLVRSHRGRNGGLELGRAAAEITVGEVVRATEPSLDLLGCFNPDLDFCVISPVCRLKSLLQAATGRFLTELDQTTLADIARPRRKLTELLNS